MTTAWYLYLSAETTPPQVVAMADDRGMTYQQATENAERVNNAINAVRLLTPEQWAWLAEYGDTAKALAEAVQTVRDFERAEAEAEALAPTYNGGRW